jgi:hypothetical protein
MKKVSQIQESLKAEKAATITKIEETNNKIKTDICNMNEDIKLHIYNKTKELLNNEEPVDV